MPKFHLNSIADPTPEAAVLCRFPQGPPSQLTDQSSNSDLTFTLHAHNDNSRKVVQRVLTADSDRVEWAGKNFLEESYKLNTQHFAIGLPDTTNKTIALYPVNHIYSMQQRVKHRPNDLIDDDDTVDSYSAKQKLLVDSFGSKKRKSQLASRESNRVVMNDEIGEALSTSISHVTSIDEGSEMSLADLSASTKLPLLPPHDAETDDVTKIFKLHDMVPQHVLTSMNGQARQIMNMADKHDELKALLAEWNLGLFVKNQIQDKLDLHVKVAEDERKLIETLSILLVIHALIQIQSGRGSVTQKLRNMPMKISEPLMQYLLSTFTLTTTGPSGKPGFSVDTEKARKIRSYLCLLCLHVNRYRLSSSDLAQLTDDLTMTATDLVTWLREIGCTKANKSHVELTAPLSLGRFKGKRKSRK